MIKKILILFVLLLLTGSLFAQSPFIRNYTPEEYKAHTQNWSIVQDARGLMYFGNGYGALEYDGTNWRTIKTKSMVYSFAIDSLGCIYLGLSDDFGYLQADSIGDLQYKSLMEKIPKEHRDFRNVWKIIFTGNEIIFRTKKKLFILKDDHISVMLSDKKFRDPFIVRNRFYINETGKGLSILENDSLRFLPDTEVFSDENILSMLPYEKEDILITTFKKGVFLYNPNKSPSLWKPEGFETVDKFLIKNVPYCGAFLSNGSFAIGTSVGGIIVFDKKGKIKNHYYKKNGLQSNSVNYLFVDLNDQLWAALDSGISLVMNNLPFVDYTDKNGLDGTVYCMQRFKNKLYVGTSNNLYVQNKDNDFQSIEGTTGQNFFLHKANGMLLLGNHQNGTFEVSGNQVLLSSSLKDLGAVAGVSLRKYPNYFITQVWDKGLVLIEYKNEQWVFKNFIKGFDKNALSIEEDITGDFWIASNFQLYKIRLNETLDSVLLSQYYSPEKYHLPETSLSPYHLNNGEIIFGSDKGIYRYLSDKDSFEVHPDFPIFTKGIYNLKEDINGNIWFVETKKGNINEKGVLQLINGKYEIRKTPFFKFSDNGTTFLYPYSDSLVYFGTTKGLLEYHPKQKVNYDISFNTLIREIFVNDSLTYRGSANNSYSMSYDSVIFKYEENNLFFHYASTFFEDSEKNLFSYRLIGSSDTTWSAWKKDVQKEYTNLYEGKYTFEVKSQNIYRKFGTKASFNFEIRPPWERTWLAYVLYVILAIIFVWILIRINSIRLQRLNEMLKRIVGERTADIVQQKDEILHQKEDIERQAEELKTTNDQLLETNATKDKFFSIISHDLRSPFNSILGFSELLNEEYDSIDDTEKREMISELNKSSQHAYDMLLNLLNWARTQRGNIEINKELLNLKELVEISVAPYALNASGKEIKIVINIPCEAKLSVDKNTSITFIGNLVNNAIKFTPKGGTISINYHENGGNIELHIIDTGVGMTSEVIGKLFRIDENVSTEGTNNEKGTGLGLILCKEFIERNGGSIQVKSEVNKGSEFIISLPQ